MSLLTKREPAGGERDLIGHMIGNALVVRPRHLLRDEIRDLALGLAADPDHELVVVDLPVDSPFAVWESAAKLLPRKRRGVRLVISGRSRETTTLAGQWLSQRLNRTVIAPDGLLMRGVGGSLFVDSGWGTGWVRFQPGKPPQSDGKRFPRPSWEGAAPLVEIMPTSAGSVVEPLPGGVWLRPRGPESVLRPHRKRLIESLPCQPDVCVVVLGCPDAPPVTLHDIMRFWGWLPAELRRQVRFVKLGPLTLPGAVAHGQAIADALDDEITCYTGIPVGSRTDPDVFALRVDGTLGWRAFAEQMTYRPARGGFAPVPALVRHRDPVFGIPQISPAVYRYAPDVVVEVVQSGLWVRPDREPPHAPAVRCATPDAARHVVLFEDGYGGVLQELAADVLGQLEPATQYLSMMARSDSLVPQRIEAAGRAMAALDAHAPTSPDALSTDTVLIRREHAQPDVVSPMPAAAMRPPWAMEAERPELPWAGSSQPPTLEAQPPSTESGSVDALAPTENPLTAPPVNTVAPAGGLSSGVTAVEPAVVAPLPGDGLTEASLPAGPMTDAPEPGAARFEASYPEPALPMAGIAATDAPAVAGFESEAPGVAPATVSSTTPSTTPSTAVTDTTDTDAVVSATEDPPAAAPQLPAPETPAPQPDRVREVVTEVQPTPSGGAVALVPKRGLEQERAWLRRTLSREYAAVANSVSRVLSEHPGFQGAIERSAMLSDAVAIRLYLSAEGDGVDLPLRSGAVGPHVPFARCVVSGLSRLPSHRGAAVFAASPTEQELEFYRSRKFFTEWGFVNALSAPCGKQRRDNNFDVVLWSMTARRTTLLEPEQHPTPDRVLFVPGTSFKVLDLVEPKDGERGRVLMRELAAGEIDASGRVDGNRASLDEMALNSLRRFLDSWADAKHQPRVADAATVRFGMLPGLVRVERDGR